MSIFVQIASVKLLDRSIVSSYWTWVNFLTASVIIFRLIFNAVKGLEDFENTAGETKLHFAYYISVGSA